MWNLKSTECGTCSECSPLIVEAGNAAGVYEITSHAITSNDVNRSW